MKKIITYRRLPKLIKIVKQSEKPLILAGGCFDILHLGHIRFLNQAGKHGALIVALESDENLKRFKGLSRPIHKQKDRAEMLSGLESVDHIILLPTFSQDNDYYKLTKTISPDIIAVTEGDLQLVNKKKQAKSVGAKIITISKIKTPSTTQLIKLLDLEKI